MTGLTDYTAKNELNYITGQIAQPALPSVWLALFTAVGTDANTGFTEVSTSGTAYARIQVGGSVATSALTASGNATLHFSATPAWITAGMTINDATAPSVIPAGTTVLSTTGTTVVMSANATGGGVGSGDTITFSAFSAGAGSQPSTITNSAAIAFLQATGAGFGTVIAFGLFDAVTSGNLLLWDFLGNFSWLPFENPTGSNLLTVKANGYASNDPIVFTAEYGGTLPTLSTGTFTSYTVNFVATPATDAINVDTTSGPVTPIVLTSSGSGMVRKIVQQSIPAGVTASFAAAQLNASAA